jgi:hypothetical protein
VIVCFFGLVLTIEGNSYTQIGAGGEPSNSMTKTVRLFTSLGTFGPGVSSNETTVDGPKPTPFPPSLPRLPR